MRAWTTRHWLVASGAAATTALVIGLPTDVIPNPVFGRSMSVTWWSYPVLLTTAVLAGLLVATYVRDPRRPATDDETIDRPTRTAGVGGLLSFFAVGCPVCNKLVLVALGSTGAVRWFEPLQPLLALISVVLLVAALRARLRSSVSCAISPR